MDILEHEKLAYAVINNHTHPMDRDDDMEQEARIGLVQAIRSFKPDKGKFSSWAYPVIKSRVCDEVNRRRKAVKATLQVEDRDVARIHDGYDRTDGDDTIEFLLTFAPKREAEVLRRYTYGDSVKEIAADFGVSRQMIEGIRKRGAERIRAGVRGRNFQREMGF